MTRRPPISTLFPYTTLFRSTGGAGTPAHVSAVYFKNLTATQAQIIHYRGAAPAMQDLFAGHIDLYFDQAVSAVPNSRAGRSEEHTSELQSLRHLVCRLLLEK